MPTIWFVRDGEQQERGRTSGDGIVISPLDLQHIFHGYKYRYIGKTPKTINPGKDSWGAEHVVVQVHENETDAMVNFGQSGFYLVEDLKPHKARELIASHKPS